MSIVDRYKVKHSARRAVSQTGGIVYVQDAASITVSPYITFADGDTTPDVSGGREFATANTGEVQISDFDNPIGDGHRITIFIGDDNTWLIHSANIQMEEGISKQYSNGDIVELMYISGVWYEWSGRSQS